MEYDFKLFEDEIHNMNKLDAAISIRTQKLKVL